MGLVYHHTMESAVKVMRCLICWETIPHHKDTCSFSPHFDPIRDRQRRELEAWDWIRNKIDEGSQIQMGRDPLGYHIVLALPDGLTVEATDPTIDEAVVRLRSYIA